MREGEREEGGEREREREREGEREREESKHVLSVFTRCVHTIYRCIFYAHEKKNHMFFFLPNLSKSNPQLSICVFFRVC